MELKPCPFCGGVNVVIKQDSCSVNGQRYWYITHSMPHKECPLTGMFDWWHSYAKYTTREKAIEAWNKRDYIDLIEGVSDNIAIYEEAGSKGCLLVTPYKIGAEVFIIAPSRNCPSEQDIYIEGVVDISARGFWTNPQPYIMPDDKDRFFLWKDVGETVFFTYEEAEIKVNKDVKR